MAAKKGPRRLRKVKGPRAEPPQEPRDLPLTRNAFRKAGGDPASSEEMVWRQGRTVPLKNVLATRPKLTVLIVHNDTTAQLVMRRALTALGVPRILEAGDGAGALELVRKRKPDLIISAYAMANGLEILQNIRNDEDPAVRTLPVIMTIATPTAQQIHDISNAGAHEILLTPFSAKALTRHIVGIFTEKRKHIESPTYIGPERRNGDIGFAGTDRRQPKKS